MLDLQNKHAQISENEISDSIIALASESYQKILSLLRTRISGMEKVIEQLLLTVFSGNHALLEGVPGLAKTLLIRSVAELTSLEFSRIQFTPDLMPSDITGTDVLMLEELNQSREFSFLRGPIFANLILADEINRTPPKTQAALLEAMEEKTVTAFGKQFKIDPPFLVLATQNPIEQGGTYPLPIAQLDRFMCKIAVDYPNIQEERKIMRTSLSLDSKPMPSILTKEDFSCLSSSIRKVKVSRMMYDYAVRLARASRPITDNESKEQKFDFIQENVSLGVSPRATQLLLLASQSYSLLHGRREVSIEDIHAVIHPVFRHRIVLNPSVSREKTEKDTIEDIIINYLIQNVPIPSYLG